MVAGAARRKSLLSGAPTLGTAPAIDTTMTTTQQLSAMYQVLGELDKAGNDEAFNLLWDVIFWNYEFPPMPRKVIW
jgi:hypothetical protein